MSKRHDAVFDAVLSGLPESTSKPVKQGSGTRFLKRSTSLSERASGETEEKTLRWVDPDTCQMWERHNRDYALLTSENCADLIDGIKSQGRQEFPAIVRRTPNGPKEFEVICGARRHFAVTWLRSNNYPQFNYLVDVRDISDEEAFRLADIENRDREDISDYERALDYASAIELYYGGRQKAMAERLEVSQPWLSRYLELARLPSEIVAAFAQKTDIKELHARSLKPLMLKPKDREKVLARAVEVEEMQIAARAGQGVALAPAQVVSHLKSALRKPTKKPVAMSYAMGTSGQEISVVKKGKKLVLEIPESAKRQDVEDGLRAILMDRFNS